MDAVQNRVTVAEAARRLGLSDDAIRKRVKRGQLGGYRAGSKWYVLLDGVQNGQDAAPPTPNGVQTDPTPLVEALQKHVQFLQTELERRDALILRLVEARALPAPSEPKTDNLSDLPPWWSWRRWAGWRR